LERAIETKGANPVPVATKIAGLVDGLKVK
jgi:hypothetical protein